MKAKISRWVNDQWDDIHVDLEAKSITHNGKPFESTEALREWGQDLPPARDHESRRLTFDSDPEAWLKAMSKRHYTYFRVTIEED